MSNLLKDNKELMKEYDFERNTKIDLKNITIGSSKKIWWNCSVCGNEWEACINHRTIRKHGCPYCSGRIAIKGKTDLATTNPDLLKEWDYEKNKVSPTEVKKGSHDQIWWKCDVCHGSWQAPAYNRISGNGCPYCANKRVLEGFNDLETVRPDLAIEWNIKKNCNKQPNQFLPGSEEIVWWKCPECNYEWQAKITVRTSSGTGCPNCSKYHSTSFPEQALIYYLKKSFPNITNRAKIDGIESDIFINDLNIGIEYDGYQWHKDIIDRDNNKDKEFKNKKIKFIRIREKGLEKTKYAKNIFRSSKSISDLELIINKVFKYINTPAPDINIKRDRNNIISQYIIYLKDNNLENTNPYLVSEWNYKKNGKLLPKMVSPFSNEKVWWKCSECGHEWESLISTRSAGSNCPVCASKIIVKGINDLTTTCPSLVKTWNYEKNTLKPTEVSRGSRIKVWWKCNKCGNDWEAVINKRVGGTGCPICSKLKRKEEHDIK